MKLEPATQAKYSKAPISQGVLQKFPRALEAVAQCSAYGAEKHRKPIHSREFMDVPDAMEVYSDAMARHVVAEAREGPVNHEDGGLLHKAQTAWNALARLECFLRNGSEDHDIK